jgi:hypothetical protein
MLRVICALTALLVVAALAFSPSQARADRAAALLRDCQDGRVDGHYAQSDYRTALRAMPTDVGEYSDCASAIRAAQLHAAANGPKGRASAARATAAVKPTPSSAPAAGEVASAGPSPVEAAAATGAAAPPPTVDVQRAAQHTPLGATTTIRRGPNVGRLATVLLVVAAFVALAGAHASMRRPD